VPRSQTCVQLVEVFSEGRITPRRMRRALCPCLLSVAASWDNATPSFQALAGPDGEVRLIA
jgi:hypothetical protein